MDHKLMIGSIAVILLILGGLAIAMPGLQNATSWSHQGPGRGPHNCSAFTAPGMGRSGNFTRPDKTRIDDFNNAVQSGDYATAKALDDRYHIGGPIFGKLNDMTFVTYSEIAKLKAQLMSELGMNHTSPDFNGRMMHPGPRPCFGGDNQTQPDQGIETP